MTTATMAPMAPGGTEERCTAEETVDMSDFEPAEAVDSAAVPELDALEVAPLLPPLTGVAAGAGAVVDGAALEEVDEARLLVVCCVLEVERAVEDEVEGDADDEVVDDCFALVELVLAADEVDGFTVTVKVEVEVGEAGDWSIEAGMTPIATCVALTAGLAETVLVTRLVTVIALSSKIRPCACSPFAINAFPCPRARTAGSRRICMVCFVGVKLIEGKNVGRTSYKVPS